MGKDQELLSASRKGDFDMVNKLLTNKSKIAVSLGIKVSAHVNCQDLSGYTPLHHASLNGHCEIVELLLDNSASSRVCDDKGCFPLHLAAWSGYSVIAQILLTHGPSVATVNEKNGDNETALHCASQHGHTTTVKVLLQNGADPSIRNIRDESALDLACQYGRLKVVQMLLQNSPTLLQRSPDCFSPLHLASRNGHKEVVELLLAHAADINGGGENGTALHEAALFGKLEVVKLLLERGANPHSLDPQNRTALELVKQMDTDMTRSISQLILARLQEGDDYECVHSITPNISTPQLSRVNNLDSPHTYMDMARAFLEKSISMRKHAVTVNMHSKWNSNDGKENENTTAKLNLSNTSSPLTSLRRSRKGGFSLRRSSSARSTKSLPRLPSTRSLSSGLDLPSSEQIRQRHPSTNMFPAMPFSLPNTPLLSFSKQDPAKNEDPVFHPTPRKRRLSLRSPHTQSMITSTSTANALESMLKQNKAPMERISLKYKDKTKPKENVPLMVTERPSVKSEERTMLKTKQVLPSKPVEKIPLKSEPKMPLHPVINAPSYTTREKPSESDKNESKQPVELTPLRLSASSSPGGSVKPKKPVRSKFSVSSILTPSPPPVPPKPHKRSFNSQLQESNENAPPTINNSLSPNDLLPAESYQADEAVYANFDGYSTDVPPSPCTAMTLVSSTLQKAISHENLFDDNPVFETQDFTSNPSVIVYNEESIVLYDNIDLPYADDSLTENQEDDLNTRTASPCGQISQTPIYNPNEQSQSVESARISSSTSNQSIASQEIEIPERNLEIAVLPIDNLSAEGNTTKVIKRADSTIATVDMQTENYYKIVTKNGQDNQSNNDDVVFLNDKNIEENVMETEVIRSPISFVEVKNARILSTKSTDSNLSASQFHSTNISTNSLTPSSDQDTASVKDEIHSHARIELDGNKDDWNDQLSDRTEDFEIPTEVRKFRGLIRGASYKGQSQTDYYQKVSPAEYVSPKPGHIEIKRGVNSPHSSISFDGEEHKNPGLNVIDRCDTNNNNSLSSGKESPFSSSDENTLPDYNTIYNTVSEVRSQSQPNSEAGDEWKQIANIMASISVDESSKGTIYAKEFEETFWKIMTGSELPLQISTWLSDLGLPQYETVLVGNGFDNVEFLANDVLEEQDLLDMGISDFSHRRKLIESAKNLSQLKPLSQMDTSNLPLTLTEWLMFLELPVEYADLFNINDVDFLTKLYALNESKIRSIIPKRGHFKRILVSLRPNIDQFNSSYQLKSAWKSTENIKQAKKVEKSRSRIHSAPGHHLTTEFSPIRAKLKEDRQFPAYIEIEKMNETTNPTNNDVKQNIILRPPNETNTEVTVSSWRHKPDALINGNCTYQAYYLGSMLIQELKGIESTREACTKMKKSTGAMKKIPTITLAINYKGVKFIDFKSKHEIAEHEIRNISFTSQDAHDLSTFAYITHDTRTGHHYCHVFRVTTLDMAYEIILTLGQAFEVAYQMILNERPQT